MKDFQKVISEQSGEVKKLRLLLIDIIYDKIKSEPAIIGALITGSVARGDARVGPYGVMIDLAIVLEDENQLNLAEVFGKDEKPFIPYHCVSITEKIGIQIEKILLSDLNSIRKQSEASIYAKYESIIIYDPDQLLENWKSHAFTINDLEVKDRALDSYFRFKYLTGDYRNEKWSNREAWIQLNHNFNESAVCYCKFLYCINRKFIPRSDWLVYLTFDLIIKPDDHDYLIENLYNTGIDKSSINQRIQYIRIIEKWMNAYVSKMKWV